MLQVASLSPGIDTAVMWRGDWAPPPSLSASFSHPLYQGGNGCMSIHTYTMDVDMGTDAPLRPCCHQLAINVRHLPMECKVLAAARRVFLIPLCILRALRTDLTYRKNLISRKTYRPIRSSVKTKDWCRWCDSTSQCIMV